MTADVMPISKRRGCLFGIMSIVIGRRKLKEKAMKTTDLMIGDWVHIHKENMCYDADYRITGIEEKYIWCGSEYFSIEDVQPIFLTPEILEKNGFERCVSSIVRSSTAAIPICNSNQFCCKDCERLRIIDRGIWHFSLITPVIGDTKQYEIHEIKYVHTLQHALKPCGIDKTIEL